MDGILSQQHSHTHSQRLTDTVSVLILDTLPLPIGFVGSCCTHDEDVSHLQLPVLPRRLTLIKLRHDCHK